MAYPLGCLCLASRTASTRLGADCSRSHLASASSNLRKNSPSESDIPSSRVRTHPPSMTTAQRHPQPATPRGLLMDGFGVSLDRLEDLPFLLLRITVAY